MKLQKLFYVILYFKRFNFSLLKLNNLLKKRENDQERISRTSLKSSKILTHSSYFLNYLRFTIPSRKT